MIELYHELEKYTDASCLKSILQEHPEVEILWERRENLQKPFVVNGEDPLLHVLYEAIVEKQIQTGEPLEVRQALERMLKLGFPRPAARGAIVKLFRWYLDSATRDSDAAADAAETGGYLQKLNFLGINPARTKRNQPCPCLSGKKFKKCCLPLSKLLEIKPTAGELHLGASAYFNPHFKDTKEDSIYTEMENRSHFARFLESTGDMETALLYLQENVRATENKPHQFQENALKELLFFCTQHPDIAGSLGLEMAERLINLPGVDSAEIGRCRCDQADLLAALQGLTRGIEAYDRLKQERPGYHYADFRRADLLQRFGQTEAALNLLQEIESRGDSVEPEIRTAVAELLRKIRPL
jgi:tetratricopeptide (TPR) repeat protein